MSSKILLVIIFCANMYANTTKVIKNDTQTLIVEVVSEYVLGDGDTRIDAKNMALQQAKTLASEYAGSFVKSELVIENDKIKKEQISTITTALISIRIVSENYSLTKDGRTKLSLIVNTELDKKSFIDKIDSLRTDDKKLEQIVILKTENEKLQKKLDELNNRIQGIQSSSNATFSKAPNKELFEAREKILSDIEINENSIKKVFQKGTLFSLAQKSGNEYKEAVEDIDTNVFQYIKNNIKITMDDPKFRDNGNGTYDIEVLVHWDIEPKQILQTLNKYFWNYDQEEIKIRNGNRESKNQHIEVSRYSNEKNEKRLPFSDKLYEYYKSHIVKINLHADKYSSNLKIGAIDQKFFGCNGSCFKIELNNKTEPNQTYFDLNPVVIKNVPKSVLEDLTTIETKVEITK